MNYWILFDLGNNRIKGNPHRIKPALMMNVNLRLKRSANFPTNNVADAINTKLKAI